MDISKQLLQILGQFCENSPQKLADMLGWQKQRVSNYLNGKSAGQSTINQILQKFPEINPTWMVKLEGDMIADNGEIITNIATGNGNVQGKTINIESVDISKLIDTVNSQHQTIQTLVEMLKSNRL